MANIQITRRHSLGMEEARRRVSELEPKLKSKFGVVLKWNGDSAAVKAPGVSGNADLSGDGLNLSLKVGLLLKPMAKKIQSAIEEEIDKVLNQ